MEQNYEVKFCEGHGFRSDPEPLSFTAESDESALSWVSKECECPVEKLHEAGIKKIVRIENGKEVTIWPVEKPAVNRYPKTLAVLSKRFREEYPHIKPREHRIIGGKCNTLWMIEQIPTMTDQGRIDRWIGWIQSKTHSMRLISLADILDLTRADLENFDSGTS